MYQLPSSIRPENTLIYLRKSRTDDPMLSVEDVLSKHEQLLDEWSMRTFGALVPAANRFREVVSGETISARPQVQKVLRSIESPAYSAILTVEPQRLSRGDLEDAGYLIKVLRYTNTLVITPVFTYDLADERDRDLFQRELQRGNEFLEYQKRIMNRGRLLAVENGCFIGQIAPYGYKKATVRIGKRLCHTLTPDPDEAPVVRLIFDLYLQGMGGGKIANYLESHGIPAPSGQDHWCTSYFRSMLTNEHYIGKVRWNRRKTQNTIRDGQLVQSRPWATEYLLCDGLHPGIVDPDVFQAAQQRRGKNNRARKDVTFANPFAGLIYCQCGYSMVRQNYKGAEPRLVCSDQRRCHTASCRMMDIIPPIARALDRAISDFEIRIAAGEEGTVDAHQAAVSVLEKRCEDLRATELRQWEMLSSGKMPQEIFDRLNEKVLSDRAQAEQALADAQENAPIVMDLPARLSTFRAALDMLLTPDAPAQELNDLLRSCIRRATYSRQKAPTRRGCARGHASPTPIHLDIDMLV